MTTDDPARLRSLAEAATPGPWYAEPGDHLISARVGSEGHRRGIGDYAFAFLDSDPRPEHGNADDDAAYIAALDPQTVLALLDAAALGLAWNRVEAALQPAAVRMRVLLQRGEDQEPLSRLWYAVCQDVDDEEDVTGVSRIASGSTPTAALLALADKLEARNA